VAAVLSDSGNAFVRSDTSQVIKVANYDFDKDYTLDAKVGPLYQQCDPIYWAD